MTTTIEAPVVDLSEAEKLAKVEEAIQIIIDQIVIAVTVQKIKKGALADVIINLNKALEAALKFPKSKDKKLARAELVRLIVAAMEASAKIPID